MADSEMDDEAAGVIRPIEQESVRRIVAGQAVTDLASAVKELVDNSLDAGSKSINSTLFVGVAVCGFSFSLFLCRSSHNRLNIHAFTFVSTTVRLFNQGLDIVEVSDDGCGVPAASRAFLAHPSATSKIRAFEDIYNTSCSSLGFRGEALFCLANLSQSLVVATRTSDEPVAQKMEFGHDGSLVADSVVPTPRKVGTTVAVVKLLQSLPVRRADMERRIVQHRSKMMRLMEGCTFVVVSFVYCLYRTCRDAYQIPFFLDAAVSIYFRRHFQCRSAHQPHGCGRAKGEYSVGHNDEQYKTRANNFVRPG